MSRILTVLAAVMLLAGPASGASITVHVARNGDKSPLEVRLGVARDDREPSWIAVRHLTPGRGDVTFRDLGAGHYALLLEGPRPLQRVSAHAVVAADDDRTLTIGIQPRPFHGRFTLGGTPLANAEVTLHATDYTTSATTDARGLIDEPLWQGGDVDLMIDSPRLGAPYSAHARLARRLELEIEPRVVRGNVSGANGEPVAGATIILRSDDETRRVPRRTMTNDKGEFRIDGVQSGSQSLSVSAPGYLRGKPIAFEIASREHVENVVLDPGISGSIEVVDVHGEAAPGATVICAIGGAIRSRTETDALGHAVMALPRDGGVVFVLPREGALVTQPAASARRITIPASNASLELDVLLSDGTPLTGISLLVRYNGTMIPPEVARFLGARQGMSFVTDDRGRIVLPHVAPGVYELWPYRSDEEVDAVMASESALAAPINLNVAVGENRATVRFKARQ